MNSESKRRIFVAQSEVLAINKEQVYMEAYKVAMEISSSPTTNVKC